MSALDASRKATLPGLFTHQMTMKTSPVMRLDLPGCKGQPLVRPVLAAHMVADTSQVLYFSFKLTLDHARKGAKLVDA